MEENLESRVFELERLYDRLRYAFLQIEKVVVQIQEVNSKLQELELRGVFVNKIDFHPYYSD